MNTLAIGRKRERAVGAFLVKQGYIADYWQPPQAKWGEADIFGCFDLLAYQVSGYPVLIQVTKNGHHNERLARCVEFMRTSGLGGYVQWMVVAYKLRERSIKEIIIHTADGEGDHWRVDIPP